MKPGSILICGDRLYVLHSFKMDPDFIVVTPMDITEEDEIHSTIHRNKVKDLGFLVYDIPGCRTLNDILEHYPELMI